MNTIFEVTKKGAHTVIGMLDNFTLSFHNHLFLHF